LWKWRKQDVMFWFLSMLYSSWCAWFCFLFIANASEKDAGVVMVAVGVQFFEEVVFIPVCIAVFMVIAMGIVGCHGGHAKGIIAKQFESVCKRDTMQETESMRTNGSEDTWDAPWDTWDVAAEDDMSGKLHWDVAAEDDMSGKLHWDVAAEDDMSVKIVAGSVGLDWLNTSRADCDDGSTMVPVNSMATYRSAETHHQSDGSQHTPESEPSIRFASEGAAESQSTDQASRSEAAESPRHPNVCSPTSVRIKQLLAHTSSCEPPTGLPPEGPPVSAAVYTRGFMERESL